MQTVDSKAIGYNPIKPDVSGINSPSSTSSPRDKFNRPPRIASCVSDYFNAILGDMDYRDSFAEEEFSLMLANPQEFFSKDYDVYCSMDNGSNYCLVRNSTGEVINRDSFEGDYEPEYR